MNSSFAMVFHIDYVLTTIKCKVVDFYYPNLVFPVPLQIGAKVKKNSWQEIACQTPMSLVV